MNPLLPRIPYILAFPAVPGLIALLLLAAGAAAPASAQNCDALPPQSDFAISEVASAPGMAMDIAAARDGRIFWVERHGAFKSWHPTTRQVTTIRNFETLSKTPGGSQYYLAVETGLQGLALDPDFAVNHWIYLRYSVPASRLGGLAPHALGPVEKLSRFTLKNNDTEVDLATEKTLLEFKVYAQCCHFGGDLEWGPDGSLWTTTGDNIHYEYSNVNPYNQGNGYSDVRSTSANSNDLRGKVLRIKPLRFPDSETPLPGVGTTYEIPAGNLRDTWTTEKEKIRPEIYSMGHRNPFSVAPYPDAAKTWAATGEAGGESGAKGEDEVNLMIKPGFYGWPYFNGNNVAYNQAAYQGSTNPFANPSAVTNESPHNTGIKVLPPAIRATIATATGIHNFPMTCLGVTWGWVRHDPMLNNKAKWPASLAGKLIVSSHGVADVRVATVDGSGAITRIDRLFTGGPFSTDVMKATQGADGAFYVAKGDALNFGSATASRIYRVAYQGPCFAVSTKPASDPAMDAAGRDALRGRRDRIANLGNTKVTLPRGARSVRAYAPDGRLAWSAERASADAAEVRAIPVHVTRGMLELRYSADQGR